MHNDWFEVQRLIHRLVSMVSSNNALLYARFISHTLTTESMLAHSFSMHTVVYGQVFCVKSTENCMLHIYNAHASHAIIAVAFL